MQFNADWMKQFMPQGQAMPAWPSLDFGASNPFQLDAQQMLQIQQGYLQEAQQIWQHASSGDGQMPTSADRRFASQAWVSNPVAGFTTAMYLLNARTLMQLVDCVQADEKTKARLRFATEQQIAAASPSNYLALNPEAQKKAIETQGQSIAQGMQNMLNDLRQGHLSMTDESQFEVGRNVGTTEGAVVFENELFQLIEYKPLTAKVHEKPFLVIPPCINKFYILDLQPANSLVRHLVQEGHRTFIVSWRNPDESLENATWDDYIEHAAIKAITQVQTLTQAKQINALGFCVGGTILGTALAVLAARKKARDVLPVASATFLTTFLDFSDTGILDIFIDEASVKLREMQYAQGGLLKGQELASTFSFLRPNDLVWNYVVGNYLKGETPPPFDLLYWNSDATNLPGPFYAWYLRNTYLENNLKKPGKLTVCGEKIDLSKIDIPAYIYGSREDHIVPIGVNGGGAYASTQILSGKKRFVMGASGHIAGVINPPAAKKRSYWTSAPEGRAGIGKENYFPATQAEWLKRAQEHPGSWWTDWFTWLKPLSGKLMAAPKTYSAKAIEPAPGRYVKVKA
jgi:polyhydroxyalkanoate synthase subunit PhaC